MRDESKCPQDIELKDFLAQIPAVIYKLKVSDSKITPVFVSENVSRLLGFSVSEASHFEWYFTRLHSEDRQRVFAGVIERSESGVDNLEYRILHKDGTYRWVDDARQVIVNGSGQAEVIGVLSDITYRKIADEQLRLQAAAMDTTANGIVITDVSGAIIWVNRAFTALTGYTLDEVKGKNPRVWKSGLHDSEFYKELWETLLSGKIWRGIFENRRKDGTLWKDEHTITPVRSAEGKMTHFVAVLNHVSAAEEQLRQSQKMEAIGQLAGGVAHDFNNLLTVINGHAQLVLNRLHPNDKIRNELDLILRAGERAAKLTHQLLAFSRKQILQPEIINLNDLTVNLNKMLRRLIREDIELITNLDPRLAPVKADPTQIDQAIINLVVNACDAMPHGGKLTIETCNVELTEEYCQIHVDAKPGHYSMISITDTGIGMSEAVKARIFEPFFTTKGQGKGTGLGLSTVFGIVKQSSSYIEVISEVGKGSTFKIFIPHSLETPAVVSGDKLPSVRNCSEVVLLVEDESSVRNVVHDILESSGYRILLATNGHEALKLCSTHQDKIDLLISDVVMPQMGGLELLKQLKGIRPETRVLLMSGYIEHPDQEELSSKQIDFIHKPFTSAGLTRKVRQVLDGGTAKS